MNLSRQEKMFTDAVPQGAEDRMCEMLTCSIPVPDSRVKSKEERQNHQATLELHAYKTSSLLINSIEGVDRDLWL